MDKKTVYQIKLWAAIIIITVMGALMASGIVGTNSPKYDPMMDKDKVVGWMGMIFFGGGGLFMLYRKLQFRRQGRGLVMLTDDGLLINKDLIPWEVIDGFKPGKYGLILVLTNNTEELIAAAKGVKRMAMMLSYKKIGCVYGFPESELEGTIEDFIKQCWPYMKKNQPTP